MLRDRLTAKFLTARRANRRVAESASKGPAKVAPASAIEVYARGRRLPSSVWI